MKINFNAKPRIEWISEGVPALIVDDFYLDPDEVRAEALQGSFPDSRAGYPGRHQPLDYAREDVGLFLAYISELIELTANVAVNPAGLDTDFSILTTPKENLLKTQSHPHIDGVALAGIVYLNPVEMGGTCFYYNEKLGSCAVTDDNRERWNAVLDGQGEDWEEPEGYVSDDFDMWKRVHTVEGKYNRYVTYPGNVFHSVEVKQNPDPTKPAEARLTQRIFVRDVVRR